MLLIGVMNGFIGFRETQIKPSDFTSIIDDTLKDFNMSFNNNYEKSLNLLYGCQDDAVIIRKFDIDGITIISLKKVHFTNRVFTLILVCFEKPYH